MTWEHWFFRCLRIKRDLRAIERGRVPERLWNRLSSKLLRKGARKLYR